MSAPFSLTPQLIVGLVIIVGAIVLRGLNVVDSTLFWSMITLGAGMIGATVYTRYTLKKNGYKIA
jgi:hypothetical protein